MGNKIIVTKSQTFDPSIMSFIDFSRVYSECNQLKEDGFEVAVSHGDLLVISAQRVLTFEGRNYLELASDYQLVYQYQQRGFEITHE